MVAELEQSQSDQRLRALDPNLPFLASEAAVDIDNLLLHQSRELKSIRTLAKRLNNSIEAGTLDGPNHSLMDPATLTVLNEAFAEAFKSASLQRVEDLLGEAAKIARLLSSLEPENISTELEKARDFCVALSRAAVAYRRSIKDVRPSHPFRK
jgi:hypothetical protein